MDEFPSDLTAPPQPQKSLAQIYALPAPIRTFPLPAFYPNNPISLLHLATTWIAQILSPLPIEPSVIHQAVWDPGSGSVHVVDDQSIRALWEQGFYGKGNLSRSEPNWLKREQFRRGIRDTLTSEIVTVERREERKRAKWERARTEQQAIRQTRIREQLEDEATLPSTPHAPPQVSLPPLGPPVGPGDLPALQNSTTSADYDRRVNVDDDRHAFTPRMDDTAAFYYEIVPPVGPLQLLALPNSVDDRRRHSQFERHLPNDKTVHHTHHEERPNGMAASRHEFVPPVGPLQLSALPNSLDDIGRTRYDVSCKPNGNSTTSSSIPQTSKTDSMPLEGSSRPLNMLNLLEISVWPSAGRPLDGHATTLHDIVHLPNYAVPLELESQDLDAETLRHCDPGSAAVYSGTNDVNPDGHPVNSIRRSCPSESPNETTDETKQQKPLKSVRFSPDVVTFPTFDSPSPKQTASRPDLTAVSFPSDFPGQYNANPSSDDRSERTEMANLEHLQLMPEEVFFLVFALGALSVSDLQSKQTLTTRALLRLFCRATSLPSPFPKPLPLPLPLPSPQLLQPNNAFLVNYAVYHHFRALGWVPRAGIKFGVDWLIYNRGPVFSHAEFGIIVIPSFSDPWWGATCRGASARPWHWLHSAMRVLSHVSKSLVLVYVDVPPPPVFDEALDRGLADALRLYSVREVLVKKWSTDRNRKSKPVAQPKPAPHFLHHFLSKFPFKR